MIVLIVSNPFTVIAQGEWNIWYFGRKAGLDFNSGSPVTIMTNNWLASNATISISDSLGSFLFYSDGKQIFNKNGTLMPNGNGLYGGTNAAQPVFAVQKPDDDSTYYIFTVGGEGGLPPPTLQGLYYSVLDLRLNGGLGDIGTGQKNIPIPLADSAFQHLYAIRHRNNHDVWVVVRTFTQQSHYLSYLVTSAGLNTNPITSNSQLHGGFKQNGWIGYLKISSDGSKLICSDSLTELCNFNNLTGNVSSLFKFHPLIGNQPPYFGYGAEFSINSHYLYLSGISQILSPPGQPTVYQYDLHSSDSAAFIQSEVLLDSIHYSGLQMGPDGKIFCDGSWGNPFPDSLDVINNPSSQGQLCNFQKNVISLNGRSHGWGFPQFLQKYYVYINCSGHCQRNPIYFQGVIWINPDSLHWDFGDPSSGGLNYSNIINPSHIYLNVGTYTVKLFVKYIDNRTDSTSISINIIESPNPILGFNRTVCIGDSVTFDAGFCAGCTYQWSNLTTSQPNIGTGQTYKTGEEALYMVSVTSPNGCLGRDTVQLFTTPVPQLTNNPLYDSICSGETTYIPLTSTPSSSIFSWTATLTSGMVTGFTADSGLVIQQTLVNTGITAGVVTYHITPKIGSCSGNMVNFPVTVIVGDSVKVSIVATQNAICQGTSVTFTATPINGGINPAYQWKVNSVNTGTNSPVFTYSPIYGDVVQCILTSSNTVCTANNPASSNTISMVVFPNLPVSVSVSPSQNPVCAGTSVTFTATPTNGGTIPSYQWKVNGISLGTNNPSYSYPPLNNDVVTCILTSSETCTSGNPASGNIVTMTVNPLLPVIIAISPSSNPFCIGNSVTFTATPTNGGTNPIYQWKVNGVNVGTNSPNYSFNPLNNDSVRCMMTSNLSCVSNNPAGSNKIILSGTLAPVVTFTSCFDTITTLNAKPIKLKGGIPLNGTYSGPGVNSTTGIFTPSMAGIGLKTITYSYTNVSLCSASKNKTILVQSNLSFTCGNNLTDIRDNKVYPTVQIGSQCWMAANLNYGTVVNSLQLQNDNCVSEKYCYNNLNSNCLSYGGLYRWDELMQYDGSPANQGLCPPGWHIPTEGEWTTLFHFYSGSAFAGKPLQDSIIAGFRALTSGVFYMSTSWNFTGFATLLWSSTSWGATKALSHGMNTYNYSVSLYPSSRANAFPARCLRD